MANKGKHSKRAKDFDPSEIEQTHGSLDTKKDIRSVEKIAGYSTSYPTSDFNEYQKYIKMLSNADLYDHAYAVNIIPIDDRDILENRLEKKFLQENVQNIFKVIPSQMSEEAIERQKRIMNGTY